LNQGSNIIFILLKQNVMAKLIKGILIGAIAGAVIGVLYAPRKGSKTRKKLRRKGMDMRNALRNEFSDMEKEVNKKYDSIKEDTSELLEQGKNRLQEAK